MLSNMRPNMLTHLKNTARLLGLTALAMLVQGYHPGLEDDAYYLAAIKNNLNQALFPHDADFFRVLFQATVFDKLIAFFLRFTHIPLPWGIFFWQCAATFLVLWGCWRIARRCFDETNEQWAAVALVAALLTLPVSGSGLSLTDQHLHPRSLATALILAAIVAVLDRRRVLAGVLLLLAFPLHLNMTPFGVSYCFFLMWTPQMWKAVKRGQKDEGSPPTAALAMLLIPLGWLFEPSSDAWRQAEATRDFYFLVRWHWYEWLGIVGPLVLLWWFRSLALGRRSLPKSTVMARVAERMVYFGVFQFAVALILMLPPRLERLRSLEPMRFLHLVYLMFVLLSGGLLARYILKRSVLRWLLLFVPLSAGMFYAQRQLYPGTVHLELPGRSSGNDWVEAFRWISHNTPVDSYFALDPRYMEMLGEDYHGFRALAERSVLADAIKDPCIVVRVPSLGPRWLREMNAQSGWRDFQRPDFLRLKSQFGVNWVILTNPPVAGLTCPYSNQRVAVCRAE
jgi:hypothetical protein